LCEVTCLDDKTWGFVGVRMHRESSARGTQPASTKNVADLPELEQKHSKSAPANVLIVHVESLASRTGILKIQKSDCGKNSISATASSQ